MERKRKLPARGSRVESASKKRTSTPPDQSIQTPTPPAPPPVAAEEPLPRSIANNRPLPTVETPQPDNLHATHYQTVTESGVLVESLHRSRQKWLSEGIFEKYWTKPVKKKGVAEQPPNNPAKDSMTKLGSCTITVEPHIFDATMYAIKDLTPKPQPPTIPQQQMYRPIIQYGPPGGVMPPTPPPPTPVQPVAQKPPLSVPQPSPLSQVSTTPDSRTEPARTAFPPGPPIHGPVPSGNQRTPIPNNTPVANPQPAPPPATVGKSTDPVIQMLAERAATDPSLKALMRIVANGEATSEELKRFQSHIDELTEITRAQKLRQAEKAAEMSARATATQNPLPQAVPQVSGGTQPLQALPSPGPPLKVAPIAHQPAQASQFQPQPQALRSKGPVPSSKPDITGIAFEFSGGNGDRYAFPKFSILEARPGGEVLASFLIVRKGSSSDSPTYDPELDYYQPITIRLFAQQARQLDALHKIVAPPEEVRRYMDDIMDSATRAEYVLLAMRLPRDTEQPPAPEKDPDANTGDPMDYQVTPWPTTNSHHSTPVPAQKAKPTKKLLTEEEQYQSFITTVT